MSLSAYLADRTIRTEGCWLWKLSANSAGYGQASWHGKYFLAHRLAWIEANGEIPEGLTIDHMCRQRICVRPSHLRLLSNEANGRDNAQSRKTHCPHDHSYEDAYRTKKGHRACRTCMAQRVWS